MSHPYKVIRPGREVQPLVIIDDYAKDPDRLVKLAGASQYKSGGKFYPGIRAAAPVSYLQDRIETFKEVFSDVFECPGGVTLTEANFSLVTTPEDKLAPIQSLPHFDGFDPNRFAILHYLCRPNQGGTAFYRHKATGFETVSEDRFKTYNQSLQKEATADGLPKGYFRGSKRFDQIYEIKPVFNRLVIYSGILLHSGLMPSGFKPDTDPSTGRLTVNIFCTKG